MCPSCLKDFEEVVWRAFTEFDMPEKVIRDEWDSSSLLGDIYDETNGQNNLWAKHTKFFLLQTDIALQKLVYNIACKKKKKKKTPLMF